MPAAAGHPVGRVAIIVGHYPLVFPVNYALEGRYLLFRTGVGTKLWATTRSNVTFEVDDLDFAHQRGWSVMAHGVAREVRADRQPSLARRAEEAAPVPWAPGRRDHLVRRRGRDQRQADTTGGAASSRLPARPRVGRTTPASGPANPHTKYLGPFGPIGAAADGGW
jgi:hypothetical protein